MKLIIKSCVNKIYMRIAIISDWHLGYDFDGELKEDCFDNLFIALKQIEEQEVDLILAPGDLFDMVLPVQDILFKAINLLNNVNIENKLKIKNKTKILKLPILAIIGNHEYRGKDYISTVELLEEIGFLKNLKAESHVFEKEKIAVFGMPGVPEKFALQVLKEKFSPKPIVGHLNILMMHQSIKEYLPFEEDDMIASISLEDLPLGFDYIINGHLHWSSVIDLPKGQKFILPGSTITTQVKKEETKKPKGYFILDTLNENQLVFHEIKGIRKTHYLDIKFKKNTLEEIKNKIIAELENLEKNSDKKAIVRIRLKGELEDGEFLRNLNLNDVKKKYVDFFYISVKNNIEEKKLKESIEQLKKIQTENKNTKDLAKDIFFEQIEQTKITKDFDYKRTYELLENGDVEKAKEILIK